MEEENKVNEEVKMNFSEKRTLSAQEKLKQLREKIQQNPPKSVIGKRLAIARLDRLENIVERRIQKNNMINLSKEEDYTAFEEYNSIQEDIMNSISDLSYERESLLRQVQSLNALDPNSKNSIFMADKERIAQNMPKGYKPKKTEPQESHNSKVTSKKKELEDKLAEIEKQIEEKNEGLNKNHEIYEKMSVSREKKLKEDLAVIKPNILKRIATFFKDKKEKFDSWKAQRKEKAQSKLDDTVKNTEGTTKREMMLSELASEYTPEEQLKFAKEAQEKLEEKKQENALRDTDKTPDEPLN